MVFVKNYPTPELNRREMLRYAGVKNEQLQINNLLSECLHEVEDKFTYKVCYIKLDLSFHDGLIDFGSFSTVSKSLEKNLHGCKSAILFAATIGQKIDRLIAKYSNISPSKALMLQAIGAERIEALCDLFNRELATEHSALGEKTRPRFSPGYGDLPLEVQRDVFAVLDCPRRIGLTLNENLLMSPSKSVTAIIGILPEELSENPENSTEEKHENN